MYDDFDNNGYGGEDYNGDGKVDINEQGNDDDDIAYNLSHPYRKLKKDKSNEAFAKFWSNSSKADKLQIIIYTVLYACIMIVGSILGGIEDEYTFLIVAVLAIPPYMISCAIISAFIVDPIIKKCSERKDKKKTKEE